MKKEEMVCANCNKYNQHIYCIAYPKWEPISNPSEHYCTQGQWDVPTTSSYMHTLFYGDWEEEDTK